MTRQYFSSSSHSKGPTFSSFLVRLFVRCARKKNMINYFILNADYLILKTFRPFLPLTIFMFSKKKTECYLIFSRRFNFYLLASNFMYPIPAAGPPAASAARAAWMIARRMGVGITTVAARGATRALSQE